jgi:hypothetical protein
VCLGGPAARVRPQPLYAFPNKRTKQRPQTDPARHASHTHRSTPGPTLLPPPSPLTPAPTPGVDPTPEQWAALSKLMLEKGHFPFFDMAYQGFASGDCDRDSGAIRTFVKDGHRVVRRRGDGGGDGGGGGDKDGDGDGDGDGRLACPRHLRVAARRFLHSCFGADKCLACEPSLSNPFCQLFKPAFLTQGVSQSYAKNMGEEGNCPGLRARQCRRQRRRARLRLTHGPNAGRAPRV